MKKTIFTIIIAILMISLAYCGKINPDLSTIDPIQEPEDKIPIPKLNEINPSEIEFPSTQTLTFIGENLGDFDLKIIIGYKGEEKEFAPSAFFPTRLELDIDEESPIHIGESSIFIKKDENHKSEDLPIIVKGEKIKFSVNSRISHPQNSSELPGGIYKIGVDTSIEWDINYASQESNLGPDEAFCWNVTFSNINGESIEFHTLERKIKFDSKKEAFDAYKDRVITITIPDNSPVIANFEDLHEEREYHDNGGILHFILQRIDEI